MILINLTALFCLFIFLHGFFPTSVPSNLKKIDLPSAIESINLNKSITYTSVVDRLIFIVIDAFRNDFFKEQYMPHTFFLYKSIGCKMIVKAQSPTVTLPRIKALTTGNVPQFSDLLFNLIRNEKISESFLHAAKDSGKSIVFYGDDTWLKLYPDLFTRSEGTTSFYVNDFYEVDNNVTRNVRKELLRNDWDLMILHYLGM